MSRLFVLYAPWSYIPLLLVPFTVQLAVLFATGRRFRPLRFAVPVLIGAADIIEILLNCRATLEDLGSLHGTVLENLGALLGGFVILGVIVFCLFWAGLALTGWGLAWALYYLIKYIVS